MIVSQKKQRQTIRLYGIDCLDPHTRLGRKTRDVVQAKISGKTVKINPLTMGEDGKIIARIFLNGQCLNTYIIRAGYGLVNRKQCLDKVCEEWIRFERYAHKRQKGIWKELEAMSREPGRGGRTP